MSLQLARAMGGWHWEVKSRSGPGLCLQELLVPAEGTRGLGLAGWPGSKVVTLALTPGVCGL